MDWSPSQSADIPFHLGIPEELTALPPIGPVPDLVAPITERTGAIDVRGDLSLFAEAMRAARKTLPLPAPEPVEADPRESQANRDNDEAFGIVRVAGPPLLLMLDGLLKAAAGVVEAAADYGTRIPAEEWADLVHGFDTVLGWLGGDDRPSSPPPLAFPPEEGPESNADDGVLVRWVRGHHLFMAICQACALALAHARQAQQRGALASARTALGVAAVMMGSGRATLRFAADASPTDYTTRIRPTLMPPVAPPRMSGLHWRDHEELIRQIRAVSRSWAQFARHAPGQVEEFESVLATTYDAHRNVCAHFVGEEPSLLASSGSRGPASLSGPSVLGRLRRQRLSLLSLPPRE
ncbi:hypothetical protein ACQEU5_24660 [Marinactinospora thermotolerans]|uniref:Uncharacterized protein n=1 Tax=Marinactinospora thermotolerans DSM 45154 TaxID=1122192 RepID=A0A1T4KIW8_9ACTN|nr:hypothetical protein [Marinactinospora thermotolerans]SJZ42341.1 hypothetical protein SAMN02745673_00403 [Marinactinospora thermotolerans DSM 45154]